MNFPLSRLSAAYSSLNTLTYRMNNLSSEVNSVKLDVLKSYGQGGVGSAIGNINSDIQMQASVVSHLADVAGVACRLYTRAEDNIGSIVYSRSGETYVPRENSISFSRVIPNEMSTFKKLWKTGAATLSIVGAGAGAAASWIFAVGSGGLAATGAVLVTTYSVNTVANTCSDLHNIWNGDPNQIGKVNYLKSTLTTGSGNLSDKAFGNREIGEIIGKGVYVVGDVTSTVFSARSFTKLFGGLSNNLTTAGDDVKNKLIAKSPLNLIQKYKQSGMFDIKYVSAVNPKTGKELSVLGKIFYASTGSGFIDTSVKAIKEIPTAVAGYAKLLFLPNFGSLRYDAALLGTKIEDLTKCVSFWTETDKVRTILKDTMDFMIPGTQ